MKDKYKSNSKRSGSSEPSQSGISDDASTTQVSSGGTALTHGVMIDSLTRSAPSNLTSWTTRVALMEFAGGRQAWYNPEATTAAFLANPLLTDTSVAHALSMSVGEAEAWFTGDPTMIGADNSVSLYADVPFNPNYLARAKFFALDPDAAELDPSFQYESQMFALDEWSQLFSECCSFHFGFLVDLDEEYHRLRPSGVVGVFNESSLNTPWYALYHYWRDEIRRTYLDTGMVQLPVGAANANWRIVDVLFEIERLMAPSGDSLLPDIKLTTRGVTKGQTGAGFGLLTDERYLDADGNSRFYIPWSEHKQSPWYFPDEVISSPSRTRIMTGAEGEILSAGMFSGLGYGTVNRPHVGTPGLGLSISSTVNALTNTEYWGNSQAADYIRNLHSLSVALNGGSAFDPLIVYGAQAPTLNFWQAAVNSPTSNWKNLTSLTGINNVPHGTPGAAFLTDGEMGQCAYWTGHSLNLVQMIEIARRMGRAIEPEVTEVLLPLFGQVTSLDALKSRGTGMTAREVPTLYNLYESKFSFNENPTRTYTAAHLGPSSIELPASGAGALVLEGITLATESGGQVVSARERYWTPTILAPGAASVTPIIGSMLAGSRFTFGLLGEHSLTSANFLNWSGLDHSFITRALGTTSSMYTKVEKPIILPAGVATAESVYASGIGRGALELVVEMVLGSLGARPKFGLGMAGFSDIQSTNGTEVINDPLTDAQSTVRTTVPMNRRSSAGIEAINTSSYAVTGALQVDQMDALEHVIGGRSLREKHADLNPTTPLFENANLALLSPARKVSENWSALLAYGAPNEVISGPAATLVSTKLIEKTMLPLRSQWGYFQFSTAGLLGMSALPNNGSFTGSGTTCFTHIITPDTIVFGQLLTQCAGSDPIWTSGVGVDTALESISDTDVLADTAVAPDYSVRGEPVITSGGNNWVGGHVMSTIVGMDTLYPTSSPMAMILAAYQYQLTDNASVLANQFTWDASSRRWEQPVVMYIDISGTANHPTQGTPIPAIGTNNRHPLQRVRYNFILSVGDDEVEDWNMMTLTSEGEFTPTIGEPIHRSPSVSQMNSVQLRFMWSEEETSFQANNYTTIANHVRTEHAIQADPQAGDPIPTSIFEVPGTVIGFKPPLMNGATLAEQTQYMVSTPQSLISTDGIWTNLTLDLDVNWDRTTVWPPTLPQLSTATNWHGTVGVPFAKAVIEEVGAPGGLSFAALSGSVARKLATFPHMLQTGFFQYGSLSPSLVTVASGSITRDPHAGRYGHYFTSSYTNHAEYGSPVAFRNSGIDIPWHQVSFIYPDDPEHKMLFRPWRTYVDSAVAKELRLTFLNLGEDETAASGPLGIEMIGIPKEFRFAELVRAGPDVARTFILEKATTKTRMVNPDNRGILVFSRTTLLDPSTQRHVISDILREYNASLDGLAGVYASSGKGKVYNRALIRDLQAGRQLVRQR